MITFRKCLVGCVLVAMIITGCQKAVGRQTKTDNNHGLIYPAHEAENQNNELVEAATPIVPTTPITSVTPLASPSSTPSPSVSPSVLPSLNFKEIEEVIFQCIHSARDEVLKILGDNYEIVGTGAEQSYDGYYYNNYGITIIFESERPDSRVAFIEIDKKVEILGVNSGMSFSQVKEIFGEAPVYVTYIEYLYQNEYEIYYKINNCIVSFRSFEEDGSNLSIYILRGKRRNVGQTKNNATGERECLWHVDEITGDLTKMYFIGENRYQPIIVDKGFIEGRIISVSENLGNNKIEPCIIVAAEKDGIFTIYRNMKYSDFREFRTCDDQGISLTGIKYVECKIDSSDDVQRYIIEITPTDDNSQKIRLDSINDSNDIWQIK